jgi:DNA polymerase-4
MTRHRPSNVAKKATYRYDECYYQSTAIHATCLTCLIEPLSLDEAYLDVTENLQGIPLARDVALAIRAKIKQETGLNASAGISYNKFLAKLASDHRKPNGQYVITPEMGPAFVGALAVGKFHGIGPATSAKMNSLGLYTGLDMRNQSLDFMQANFGKFGSYYYWISRGIDDREVRANRTRKSVGAENTFANDVVDDARSRHRMCQRGDR